MNMDYKKELDRIQAELTARGVLDVKWFFGPTDGPYDRDQVMKDAATALQAYLDGKCTPAAKFGDMPMSVRTVKEMVKDNKRVKFIHYKQNELWYQTECGFDFPVPISDTGDGVFLADDKAMLFMRYIRKHLEMLVVEQAKHEANLD